ncbi:MAG: hypothetical protein FJX15_15665, partial [Alphaproteobacteria bacterium]|nr:hypothetical protein [Alphaproteobacteria bacterium]
MEIGDDKELMAEFAEFKELLRHDLNQTTASAAPPVKGLERGPKTAAVDQGLSPQAPRAEEAWSALHATEEEFLSEPEEELEGAGRRGLFYAAAAIVIMGLAALTWVLGPWAKTNTSEDPA